MIKLFVNILVLSVFVNALDNNINTSNGDNFEMHIDPQDTQADIAHFIRCTINFRGIFKITNKY